MARLVKCLPSLHEALSLIPSTPMISALGRWRQEDETCMVTSDFCITLLFTIAVRKCCNQSKLGEVILELIMTVTW